MFLCLFIKTGQYPEISKKYEICEKCPFFPHIGPECRLFAVKSTSAETGMGVTSRP